MPRPPAPRLYDPHALYVGGLGRCLHSGALRSFISVPADRKILADNYEMMQKWYAFLLGRAQQTTEEQQTGEYAKYTVLNGLDYGEWCEPGITAMQAMMNPRKSVGTAYLAYSGRLLAEIAQALGKAEDAAQYRDTAEKARLAYHAAFTDHGKITSDRQCEYVRAIAFGLLDEAESQAAADTLNQMVLDNGCHLNTGFFVHAVPVKVLAEHGHTDTAYKLLLQDTAPSWLYEVKQGATTVWETWTGIDEAGHPQRIAEPLFLRRDLRLAVRRRVRHPSGGPDPDHRSHPEPCTGLGKSGVRFPGGAH